MSIEMALKTHNEGNLIFVPLFLLDQRKTETLSKPLNYSILPLVKFVFGRPRLNS